MERTEDRRQPGGIVMASKVYNKVVRLLCEVVARTHGESLETGLGSPKDRFARVVEQLETLLGTEAERRFLADALDVDAAGSVAEIAERLVEDEADETRVRGVDEIAPSAMKEAFYEVASSRGRTGIRVDVPLQVFLRDALKIVFERKKLKGRINVGANRHLPRLLQYVRECEDETWWSDADRGVRLRNAGGRGRVAEQPTHPATLKVVIDLDNL